MTDRVDVFTCDSTIPGAQKLLERKENGSYKTCVPIINGQHLFRGLWVVCCLALGLTLSPIMLLPIQTGLSVQDTQKELGEGLAARCLEMLAHPILYMSNLRSREGKGCPQAHAAKKGQGFDAEVPGKTLTGPPGGVLTSQSVDQFPGLDVEGDGSNASLGLPPNRKELYKPRILQCGVYSVLVMQIMTTTGMASSESVNFCQQCNYKKERKERTGEGRETPLVSASPPEVPGTAVPSLNKYQLSSYREPGAGETAVAKQARPRPSLS